MMAEHKQVRVRVGEWEAEVDEGIAPLIRQLWRAGIDTVNSCQENRPGIAWVEFATAADCADFLSIVAVYEPDLHTLYNRITGRWDDGLNPVEGVWEYDCQPHDFGLNEWERDDGSLDEAHSGEPDFAFLVSVRFPVSDLATIVRRLTRHNRRAARRNTS